MMKIKQSVAKREASVTSSMRSHIQLQKIRVPNGKKKKKKLIMIKMVEETQSLEFFLYDSRCGRERETSKFFLYLEKKYFFNFFESLF